MKEKRMLEGVYTDMQKKIFSKDWLRYNAPVLVCLAAILILIFLPTGFEGAVDYQGTERVRAEVLSVDNSTIVDTGLVRSGEQRCRLRIEGGMFKGVEADGVNMLNGSLEQDKIFYPGDQAMVVVSHQGDTILTVTITDHYRLNWELVMGAAFAVFLILFAGKTGLRAIGAFALTILCLWKLLVPFYLRGWNPIWLGLGIILFLTVMIIGLVYGFDKRCAAAVSGSFLGILVTCLLGVFFTDLFKIHGAVMSYSESLLYSGFQDLNLTQIYMASIFIGASGAVIGLSGDIAAGGYEVTEKRPDLLWKEATKSGLTVGRNAMGTMTTTLLFAYSGGYIALLMVFMAQGTPIDQMLNYKYVAAELIHTVIGSFGLVTVAPFTALCSGILFTWGRKPGEVQAPLYAGGGAAGEAASAANSEAK